MTAKDLFKYPYLLLILEENHFEKNYIFLTSFFYQNARMQFNLFLNMNTSYYNTVKSLGPREIL